MFLTKQFPFEDTYKGGNKDQSEKTAYFKPKIINSIRRYYETVQKPLLIGEFCCGYGVQSQQILEGLQSQKIPVELMECFDISQALIDIAKKNFASDKLQFHQKDLETQFEEEDKYDVMIVLYGMHWMQRLDLAVKALSRSLKKGGIFIPITFMDHKPFFQYRENMIRNSQWKKYFENIQFVPFHYECEVYSKEYGKYFKTQCEEEKIFEKENTRNAVISMLQGFTEETKVIKSYEQFKEKKKEITQNYLNQFVDKMPEDIVTLRKKDDRYWIKIRLHYYEGIKI